jgi:hypothetical protein
MNKWVAEDEESYKFWSNHLQSCIRADYRTKRKEVYKIDLKNMIVIDTEQSILLRNEDNEEVLLVKRHWAKEDEVNICKKAHDICVDWATVGKSIRVS